ncbi:NAD(P)(+) transhydrogenase (Re/Si-specific) subunit beta [Occallatibacter riparius]|uniref:NAD(P) transhydrogenase subunit beta n=1 Tax=Occallatibacter riparius TaxID=1002689 RepID=A0A9J7BJU6_9BACT|nr:NAD(P)(+) transhydrogenase (Re/Si-specific) subunit beta [Occallatibacter riparius]UWZ82058.1 NAD(P)(+) transhydrogenase (Re/Si-specific) subunit beta [Occallatibacter riparius]
MNFATYSPSMYFMEATYLIASILFILSLKMMSHPDTARRGMFLAEGGMFAAVVGTLIGGHIISWTWIIAGLSLGSIIGAWMAVSVPMTAMPQRTALSHAFGALAAALVGIGEFLVNINELGPVKRGALGFEIILGALTTTGSLIAAGKLQGIVPGRPIQFKGQNIVNLATAAAMAGCFFYFWFNPEASAVFYSMLGIAFLFGVMLVIPIGSADMPVVMSLLNSYAGLAAAATGFVLGNNVLIIAGTLDGFSGFILSVLMCKAMNRSITNVLFGGFGSVIAEETHSAGGVMREISLDDAAMQLAFASRVIFVPGYGLATAQAQHAVRELADMLEERGVTVKYAIHPVAGRMPGHMNVLLAEANVPYSALYEMEQINPEFPSTDVAVVIGANDVVNPDARDNPKSLIAGMPILEVDRARSVIVLKRGQGRGFSGLENPLFFKSCTSMLYGDAKSSLTHLAQAVQHV